MATVDPEAAVRATRRIMRWIGLLFVAAMLFTVVRDLYTGVSRQYPGGRSTDTPPAARRNTEPDRYWTNLALNAASGLFMGGVFYGVSFLVRSRKSKSSEPAP